LVLRVTPENATVRIDDRPIDPHGPVELTAQALHRVVVSAPRHLPYESSVSLLPGATFDLKVRLSPLARDSRSKSVRPKAPPSGDYTLDPFE
jgi:hypothetical protein